MAESLPSDPVVDPNYVPYYQRGGDFFLHVAEFIATAIGMVLIIGVPMIGVNFPLELYLSQSSLNPIEKTFFTPFMTNLMGGGLAGALLLLILLLTRLVRHRALVFILTPLLIITLSGTLFYISGCWDVYKDILEEWPRDVLGKPPIMFPLIAIALPYFVLPIAGFLAGIYVVRRSFAYWKFFLGSFTGLLITYAIVQWPSGVVFPSILIPSIVLHLLFYLMIIKLPLQKRAFERLFRISLSQGPDMLNEAPSSFVTVLLGHVTLAAILLLIPLTSFHTYHSVQFLNDRPEPLYHSPAEINAWDILRTRFGAAPPTPTTNTLVSTRPTSSLKISRISTFYALHDGGTKEQIQNAITMIHPPEAEKIQQALRPNAEDIMEVRNAEYFSADFTSFKSSTLFEVAKVMAAEAIYMYANGNQKEAFENLAALYHLGGLMKVSEGGWYTMAIGVRCQRIANTQLRTMFLLSKDNPEELSELLVFMEIQGPLVRKSFASEAFKSSFPSKGKVAVFVELSMSNMRADIDRHYFTWMKFDTLEIAIAAELYSHEYGEYPPTLEAMVPQFLPRVSVSPIDGQEYKYIAREESSVLRTNGTEELELFEKPYNDALSAFYPPDFVYSITQEGITVTIDGKKKVLSPEEFGVFLESDTLREFAE